MHPLAVRFLSMDYSVDPKVHCKIAHASRELLNFELAAICHGNDKYLSFFSKEHIAPSQVLSLEGNFIHAFDNIKGE
jgi:hypothetical protein